MRQLVSQHLASVGAHRRVPPMAEYDVLANRKRVCLQPSRHLSSPALAMNPDIAEITPESRFEEAAGLRRKRLAGIVQHLLDVFRPSGRHRNRCGPVGFTLWARTALVL